MDGSNLSTTVPAAAPLGTAPSVQQRGLAALRARLAGAQTPPFEIVLPAGDSHPFGTPGARPAFRILLRTPRATSALASLDEFSIAMAYVDGDIDVEGDFLAAFSLRRLFVDGHPMLAVWRFLRARMMGRNRHDKAAIGAHYDLGNEFYWTFLDREHKLYSQALFTRDDESLEQAAQNKLDYIHASCRLGPGSRALDVGAGWGSFSRYAARHGIDVTMLTLSKEQLKYLSGVAAEPECAGLLTPKLMSIWELDESKRYDAIVLLGVMEHLPDYHRLMRKFASLLDHGGFVYMDFSASQKKYDIGTFAHQVVFPGDHSPVVMHDLLRAANAFDFEIIAVHNDRHSYYLTTKAWAERLEAGRDEVVAKFGSKAFRSFQLYLWSIANSTHAVGDLLSYRVVLRKSIGLLSEESRETA